MREVGSWFERNGNARKALFFEGGRERILNLLHEGIVEEKRENRNGTTWNLRICVIRNGEEERDMNEDRSIPQRVTLRYENGRITSPEIPALALDANDYDDFSAIIIPVVRLLLFKNHDRITTLKNLVFDMERLIRDGECSLAFQISPLRGTYPEVPTEVGHLEQRADKTFVFVPRKTAKRTCA